MTTEPNYYVHDFKSTAYPTGNRFDGLLGLLSLDRKIAFDYAVVAAQRQLEDEIDPKDTIVEMLSCQVEDSLPQELSNEQIMDFDDMFDWMHALSTEVEPVVDTTLKLSGNKACIKFHDYREQAHAIVLEIL